MLLALAGRLQLVGGNATALLVQVQAQYPDDFWTNFTLANMLYGEGIQGRGDPAQAIIYYRAAMKIRQKSLAVYNNLGLVLFAKNWLDDKPDEWGVGALETFRQALWIDPAFSPASNNFGYALKAKGDWGGAMYQYDDALRNDPDSVPAHANVAEIRAGEGLFNDAIVHYLKALRLDPDFSLAHYGLGLALEAKGYLDEADECYPEGVKTLDQFRGFALRESLTHYQQALESDPEWAPVPNMLQISPQELSRLNEAIGHFRQAIRAEPQLARAHAALGQALLAKRDLRKAEASTQRSLDLLSPGKNKFRDNLESHLQQCRTSLGS